MRACRHDIFENISENIFEDIFKEIASAAHADRGAPHHLVALGVVRRHLPSLLSRSPSLPRSPLSLDLGVETVFPKNRRSWAWWNWEELTEGTV